MMNWSAHIDELGDRESELTDMLTEAGYDIAGFLTEHFQVRKKAKLVQQDPAEMAFRSTVDKVLDSKNPVKVASATGNVTTVVPVGASGFSGASTEAEELAEVDVLEDGAHVDERGEVLSMATPTRRMCSTTMTMPGAKRRRSASSTLEPSGWPDVAFRAACSQCYTTIRSMRWNSP